MRAASFLRWRATTTSPRRRCCARLAAIRRPSARSTGASWADVHDYLRGATRDADLARDLTAETFARTLESLGRFRGLRPQSGRVYVFRVAQRLVAEHARSRTAELDACRRLSIAPPSDDADGRDAIAALTPDQREAVGLCVLLDREYACGGALTCGPNLSKSVPITFMIESGPGHPTVVTGLASYSPSFPSSSPMDHGGISAVAVAGPDISRAAPRSAPRPRTGR